MTTLKSLGCGLVMLSALIAMYKVTNSVLGVALISATVGVRQGSPTSCFLFTIFVNTLIRWLKERCPEDGFLRWLHVLMLMDDTVILATTRQRLQDKLDILNEYCLSHGMVVNITKAKLMVINGDQDDRRDVYIGELRISHCNEYVYLGAIFTSDGSTVSSISSETV